MQTVDVIRTFFLRHPIPSPSMFVVVVAEKLFVSAAHITRHHLAMEIVCEIVNPFSIF